MMMIEGIELGNKKKDEGEKQRIENKNQRRT